MTEKTLISFDAGKSTGIAIGAYSDTQPYTLKKVYQIEGGVEQFVKQVHVDALTSNHDNLYSKELYISDNPDSLFNTELWTLEKEETHPCELDYNTECLADEYNKYHKCAHETWEQTATIVAEKFTARGSGNAFAYKTDALEPLRIEGALLALGLNPIWQSPQQMYFMVPSGHKGNKKTLMHKWLKDHNLYVTGKDVDCKDADDARSAIIHAIVYLRNIGHKPTLDHYFKDATNE